MAVGTYKTLRNIDGIDYITLEEHRNIVNSFTELMSAVDSLKETVGSLGDPVRKLIVSLDKTQKTQGIHRKF